MSIGADDEPFIPGAPPLRVVVDRAETRVAARGELDAATAPRLRVAIDELLGAGSLPDDDPDAVVVDLRQVAIMASAGVEVLVRTRNAAEEQGRELIVQVVADGPVARTLQHAGFETRHGVTVLDVESID